MTGPVEEVALADVVARLRRAMRRAARALDPGTALSVAQLELLSCVGENPGVRPGQVARLLRAAPNSVATLVTGLHDRGLLVRTPSADDRRAVQLTLTPEGEQAVTRWQSTNTAILDAASATLDPDQRRQLAAALPTLAALVGAIDRLADPDDDGSP